MKKILLLVFLYALKLNSQVEFSPTGAHWKSAFNVGGFPPSNSNNFVIDVSYTGKAFIDNDSVKVISSNRFFLNGNHYNSSNLYLKQTGDTVFMENIYTQNQWQILFNFGALAGAKWNNILYPQGGTAVSYTSSVLSTQNVLINGVTLKQLVIEQNNDSGTDSYVKYTLTERFGADAFVFPFAGTANPDGNMAIGNLCYTDNAFGFYYFGGSSCNLTTGIEKNMGEQSLINIFPNPANRDLKIKVSAAKNNTYAFEILNATGKMIKHGSFDLINAEGFIDTEELPDGIYFLKLKSTANETASKKFFIAR